MAVQAKAASAVSQTYPTLQAGDLFGIERASVFGKMTWAQFQANDMSLSGSMTVSGTLTVSGATTFTANTTHNDNVKAIFGTGGDLEIYHTGAQSFIADVGTGNLALCGTNLGGYNSDASKVFWFGADGGNLTLYHDNASRFATRSGGAEVTTGGLLLNERADHGFTPAAGKAEIWVKSDTPTSPFFTSDTGVDTKLAGTAINETITGNWTFSGTVALPANAVGTTQIANDAVTLAKIADAALSGADATLVTGTAGTNGNLSQWNADGDLVNGPDVLDEDNMASDSASAVPTQQSVKAYVDTNTTARRFTSTAQTIVTGAQRVIAHGLASAPGFVSLRLKCLTTEGGYAVNDEIIVGNNHSTATANNYTSILVDGTNVTIRFSSTGPFNAGRKDTGATFTITPANWELYVEAMV